MRIFDDGRIYEGEIDWGSLSPAEITYIEDHSIEIADDSADAIAIRAGETATVNDVATEDYDVVAPDPTEAETSLAALQLRFDNDDLDATDLPDFFVVIKDLSDRLTD
jgi:hypothetical protein